MSDKTTTQQLKYPLDVENTGLAYSLFIAKKYTTVANKKSISELTTEDGSILKQSLGSVALYLPPFTESFNTTWDFTLDIKESTLAIGKQMIKGSKGNELQRATGTAMSNNEISTFTDVSHRNYTFAFQFTPKSSDEAKEISKIVNFFRYHSLPDYHDDFRVELPTVFEVITLGIDGSFKNTLKYKPMVLNSVTVVYGDDDHIQLMSDGAIAKISLSLTMTEIHRPMKKDFKESWGMK